MCHRSRCRRAMPLVELVLLLLRRRPRLPGSVIHLAPVPPRTRVRNQASQAGHRRNRMDTNMIEASAETATTRAEPLLRGIHHLALNTSDMRMTLDFYVRILGMRLVHGLRTPSPPPNAPPAHGIG